MYTSIAASADGRRMTGSMLGCVIVGEGTLPIMCCQILSERGHQVLALVSPDPDVLDWARTHGIAHVCEPSGLVNLLQGAPMDYLFSAVNFRKLPSSLLTAVKCHAVNYHDGPLPRYAGMHATTWALINDEAQYAVTWHLMTQRTDAGDILSQIPVVIDPDETALTLNAKCYEAAVAGFLSVVQDIEAGTLIRLPQNPQERSYFGRYQRPGEGCTLRFDAPADRLHALLRALDFGPYPNPMGLPKIALSDSFAIVTELDVLDHRSSTAPGTVLAIQDECLVVSTASDDVELAGFFTMHGKPMEIADVVDLGHLRVGGQIAPMQAARANRLAALGETWARHERFWLAELAGTEPLPLPFAQRADCLPPRICRHDVDMTLAMQTTTAPGYPVRDGERLLAAFLMVLARLAGRNRVDVGYSDSRLYSAIGDLGGFFSICLPLRVLADREQCFGRFAEEVSARLEVLREHGSHARDAALREPSLRERLGDMDTGSWPVALELLDDLHDPPLNRLPAGRVLVARFRADGRMCTVLHDPGVIGHEVVARIAAGIKELLARFYGPAPKPPASKDSTLDQGTRAA